MLECVQPEQRQPAQILKLFSDTVSTVEVQVSIETGLSKLPKIKIYKPIILPVPLDEGET